MEVWIESYDTFCEASLMLSASFSHFYNYDYQQDANAKSTSFYEKKTEKSPYADVSTALEQVMKDIHKAVQPAVRENFIARCLRPVMSILSLVPRVMDQLQERKTILLDFDSYKAKMQKEHAAGRDSNHPNVVKKTMKLDISAKQLHAINCNIFASFNEFEKARGIMLGAEFASFLACFYHHVSYSSELMANILPVIPQASSSLRILELAANTAAPTGFKSVKLLETMEEVKIQPILERSEAMGGSYGGYAKESKPVQSEGTDSSKSKEDTADNATSTRQTNSNAEMNVVKLKSNVPINPSVDSEQENDSHHQQKGKIIEVDSGGTDNVNETSSNVREVENHTSSTISSSEDNPQTITESSENDTSVQQALHSSNCDVASMESSELISNS